MDVETSYIKSMFLFNDRQKFDAGCEHDRLRSSIQQKHEIDYNNDPWKQPPLDFTLKNFHPNRKRSTKTPPNISDILPNESPSRTSKANDPSIIKQFSLSYGNARNERKSNDYDFLLNTRIKYEKVHRILNTEQYKNPSLHDYRQYPNIKELGLSEFSTAYEKDPFNIRFHTNNLNTMWLQEREEERIPDKMTSSSMYRMLTARPRWDSRLILPKPIFPNKYAAYTRYRNPVRSVQSAYWERVEDHIEQKQKKASLVT